MDYERRNDRIFGIFEPEQEDVTDELAVSMLEQNKIKGLLPFKAERMDEKIRFRVDVTGLTRLCDYLDEKRNKQEVITLFGSMIDAYSESLSYLLVPDMMLTDTEDVFVTEGRCVFAYIPLKKKSDNSFMGFVREVLYSIRYVEDEDYSYLFDLQNAFGRGDIRDISDLKRWLLIVTGMANDESFDDVKEVEVKTPSEDTTQKEVLENEGKAVDEPKAARETVEGLFAEFGVPLPAPKQDKPPKKEKAKKEVKDKSEESGLFKLFGKKEKKKSEEESAKQNDVVLNETSDETKEPKASKVINDYARGDSTVLVSGKKDISFALVNKKNNKMYAISVNPSILGSSSSADIAFSDNKAISRRHAEIYEENGAYYIKDLGSTNGTFVNGGRINKDEVAELSDGDNIKLSDETFIFTRR